MKVKVRAELASLTDGRERFAGKEGLVERAPFGRLAADPENPTLPGEHFEHAYEVRFSDGDEAVFLGSELEGEGVSPFQALKGPAFGGREAAASAEAATVAVIPTKGGKA